MFKNSKGSCTSLHFLPSWNGSRKAVPWLLKIFGFTSKIGWNLFLQDLIMRTLVQFHPRFSFHEEKPGQYNFTLTKCWSCILNYSMISMWCPTPNWFGVEHGKIEEKINQKMGNWKKGTRITDRKKEGWRSRYTRHLEDKTEAKEKRLFPRRQEDRRAKKEGRSRIRIRKEKQQHKSPKERTWQRDYKQERNKSVRWVHKRKEPV